MTNSDFINDDNERFLIIDKVTSHITNEIIKDFIFGNVSESSSDSEDDLGDIRLEEDEIHDKVYSDNDEEERSVRDEVR